MVLPTKVLLALLPFVLQASAQQTGKTTRYWDCCKASCGWSKKISLASGASPVKSCDRNDSPLSNFDAYSACDSSHAGGPAYMCSDQSPWAVNDNLAYGFAAATIAGGSESSWCCGCYELTFTSGPVSGKKMVVQVSNTGGDLGSNQFDLAIPGGGFGIFNGCSAEWGTPSGPNGWGQQYGGVSSRSDCDGFPAHLKQGCYFRFDWFKGADNPAMTFQKVNCPAAITAKSGCLRAGESTSSTIPDGGSAPSSGSGSGVTTPSAGTIPQYGQCGGIGWAGATACAAGFTCTPSGDYYSQCL